MGLKMNITTARHQNANGLAEAGVKATKNMLTILLKQHPGTPWTELLPLVQLAYNNTPHTSTGFSPNELTYGQNLNTQVNIHPTKILAADELCKQVHHFLQVAQKHMEQAQERQAKAYNRSRRTLKFKLGDLALLLAAGLALGGSEKYTHHYLGPFRVIKIEENDNYKLKLPPVMRIHPIFHVSKLAPYCNPDDTSFQSELPRPPVVEKVVDQTELSGTLEKIIGDRFAGKRHTKQYNCKYHDDDKTSWKNASHILKRFPVIVQNWEYQDMDAFDDLLYENV